MNKRSLKFNRIMIAVLVAIILFATGATMVACNSNPNQGRIRGLNNGEFSAIFLGRDGVDISPFDEGLASLVDFVYPPDPPNILLLDSLGNLLKRQEQVFFGLHRYPCESIEEFELRKETTIRIFAENALKYNQEFFTQRQLIIVSFGSSPYSEILIDRVNYQGNVLEIRVRDRGQAGFPAGGTRVLILEITRISSTLEVVFSGG